MHYQIVNASDLTKVIARGSRDLTNGLYRLESNNLESHIYVMDEDNSINLWHSRLGHVNFRTLHEMIDIVTRRSTVAID